MELSQIDEILERMYATCGVDNDYQLAKFLGLQASSVKGWRIAKHPPFKACFEIFTRTGVTVEWLVTGQSPGSSYNHDHNHSHNHKISHVAEREVVYSHAATQQDLQSDSHPIRMPLEQFQSLFREAIIDGISMQFLELASGTDRRSIDALAARFYRKVNDPVILPDTPDKQNDNPSQTFGGQPE